jgi:hypothetical protein
LVLQLSLQESLVDYVNRKVLYELKGRYDSLSLSAPPADTIMSGYLNLLNINSTTLTLTGTNTLFTSQVNLNSSGSYNKIKVVMPAGSGADDMCLTVKSVVDDTTLILSALPTVYSSNPSIGCTSNLYNLSSLTFSIIQNATYIYVNGGENAHESTLELLSAKAIAEKLNSNNSTEIEYVTVKEDGSLVYNEYVLNVNDGTDVYKPTIIEATEDTNIPNSYKGNTSAVGHVLRNRQKPYISALKRLNGNYNPTFNTVLSFYSPYNKYKCFLDQDIDFGSSSLSGVFSEIVYDSSNNSWSINGTSTQFITDAVYDGETYSKIVVSMPSGSTLEHFWISVKSVLSSSQLILLHEPRVYDTVNGVYTNQPISFGNYNESASGSITSYSSTDLDTATYDYMTFDRNIARRMIFNQLFFRKGVEFMTSSKNFGTVKNLFYHKVNEINVNSVTKLAQSSAYQPVYPLIGEVAIDKRDINVFTSQFEKGFYVRSLANSLIQEVYGTKSPVIKKAFMSSALMQPSPVLYLTKFTSQSVNSFEQLNKLRDTQTFTTQSVIFESNDQIFIDFYNEVVIADELMENGLLQSIKKNVLPEQSFGNLTSVEDDAREYALKNLLQLYLIENVSVFVKQVKVAKSFVSSANSYEEVLNSDHQLDGNFTFQLHANKPFNMRLIYNKRAGYTYSVLPVIKISI